LDFSQFVSLLDFSDLALPFLNTSLESSKIALYIVEASLLVSFLLLSLTSPLGSFNNGLPRGDVNDTLPCVTVVSVVGINTTGLFIKSLLSMSPASCTDTFAL